MSARPIIIDCDPGQDDAVNLFLAFASPDELNILGVTTVAGNVRLELTSRNARMVRQLAGREDVPVYAGCDRPLEREPIFAAHVHGPSGVDGMEIFQPSAPLAEGHAVDFIIETLSAADDDAITLVVTGPCTNIATVIAKDASVLPKIKEIVLMGGAMREGGNITPSAEFNMFADPHAAKAVFACGRPIVAIGLDATHQVLCTPKHLAPLRAMGGTIASSICEMMAFTNRHDTEKYESEGGPLHDPCTIGYLLRPDLFATKTCRIDVEADSDLTAGHTAVDFWGVTDRPANAIWVHDIDADGFFDLLAERIGRL